MNLTELKQDLAKGILISPCTWHALLEHAIAGRDNALEEAALICDQQALEPECPERAEYCADAIRALKSTGLEEFCAIGKPDGEEKS